MFIHFDFYCIVAVVSLEETFYSVSEDVGAVELCAVISSPTVDLIEGFDCPVTFSFEVVLLTYDNTAGTNTHTHRYCPYTQILPGSS